MRMPSDKEANAPVLKIDPTFGEMAVQIGNSASARKCSSVSPPMYARPATGQRANVDLTKDNVHFGWGGLSYLPGFCPRTLVPGWI
jgi:hypothetical protein